MARFYLFLLYKQKEAVLLAGTAEQVQIGGGAEQRWEQVRYPENFSDHTLSIVGKRPFITRLATLHPYLFTVRFRKDFNTFEKRHYNGQQN